MKKFIAKLLLAVLPIAIYAGIFVAFEPNDYFGLQGKDTMITRVKQYGASNINSIILGDSRLAHIDMSLVNTTAGREYYNLAFGGASLEESIDLVYFAKKANPKLNEVVLGLSFYTLNASYNTQNRISTIEKQLKNPIAYMSNLQYNTQLATALLGALRGVPLQEGVETSEHTKEDYEQNGETLPYRKDLIAYASVLYNKCAKPNTLTLAKPTQDATLAGINANEISAAQLANEMLKVTKSSSLWSVNEQQLMRLCELGDYCKANDIKLYFVLPPMDISVRELVCMPLGIDKAMLDVIEKLKANDAIVLDYEWTNVPSYKDTQYYDGFHLDTVHGLPQWTKTLFTDIIKG